MQVKEVKPRLLNQDEIDCRVSQGTKDGVSLLLYKDARVDQKILDEIYGPMNWQRTHQTIDGRLYCTISVWDDDKKQWVSKQDVGTESNTEAEKGQASDSFKRAAFNWGIGRELYSAPFIWVDKNHCKMESYKDRAGKDKWTTRDKFEVKSITYKANGEIDKLEIVNAKTKEPVWPVNSYAKEDTEQNEKRNSRRMTFDDIKKKLDGMKTISEVNAFAKEISAIYQNPTDSQRHAIQTMFTIRREEITESRNTYHADN